jgi:CheY-like chemotaxis protein
MAELFRPRQILPADDDPDDNLLYRDALEEIYLPSLLTTVRDGEQLIGLLMEMQPLPDILFLDLNMPKKNGLDCLKSIRQIKLLRQLPVIIFSTSFEPIVVDQLYDNGARYYIRKPNDYSELKQVIVGVLTLTISGPNAQPSRNQFELLS